MKIWELKSSFDDYESFQLLNLEEDSKSILKGKLTRQQKHLIHGEKYVLNV